MAADPKPAVLITEAESELAEASRWYDEQAGLGQRFLDAVTETLRKIEQHPELHPAPASLSGAASRP